MNFFSFKSAAERYHSGRPFFHPCVINRFKELLSLKERVALALDVGCGTGLSTVALEEIARRIVGVDAAPVMIAQAPRDARLAYAVAVAESLPFGDHTFDVLTLSQVCHWLDREKFFAEARRVLRPSAWLIVYDAYFSRLANENPGFQTWHQDVYHRRYPNPARSWFALTADEAEALGFQLHTTEQLSHTIRFTLSRLVEYLLTQSNVIAAVEGGEEEIGEVRRWLTEGLRPLFAAHTEIDFLFSVPIWFLQSKDEREVK